MTFIKRNGKIYKEVNLKDLSKEELIEIINLPEEVDTRYPKVSPHDLIQPCRQPGVTKNDHNQEYKPLEVFLSLASAMGIPDDTINL